LDKHVPLLERTGVEQYVEPLASSELSAAVLGFDPSGPAARPGRLPLLFEAVENILHVASQAMNGAVSIDDPARPEPRLCALASGDTRRTTRGQWPRANYTKKVRRCGSS